MPHFEPTLQAAHARLAAVDPVAYAHSRNALDGAVTRLSPYLTHGFFSLRDVFEGVHARHPLNAQDKLVFELGWRAYYRHVWENLGDGIHRSIHAGLLPDDAYQTEMPADVLEARTGIAVIDRAVRELYFTGYVHNHARLWLASYLIHLRKVHWRTGAQWMLGHLLDGDMASNHLSWQWVAGTGSSKPYVFNADNVAKYAPVGWRSPGTLIDTSYEAIAAMARSRLPANPIPSSMPSVGGVAEPPLVASPPDERWTAPDVSMVRGRDVWLLHPWSVISKGPLSKGNVTVVGVALAAAHAQQPWSVRRWSFVTDALQTQTEHLWWTDVVALSAVLPVARSVRWHPDPHMDRYMEILKSNVSQPTLAPALFASVHHYCTSFSQWWHRTQLLV